MQKGLIISMLILLSVSSGISQDLDKGRFSDVNLNELRNTVHKHLLQDDLINSKSDTVYLSLREKYMALNGQAFSQALRSKYTKILAPYNIGTGPNRTILLTGVCSAVGDFMENSFHGKSKGRLQIEYASRAFDYE